MPVVEGDLQVPGPIRLLLHGMDMGTPLIEIANHGNRLRLRRRAEEVGRLGHVSGRVTAVVGAVRRPRTHSVQRLHLVIILDPWEKRFHRVDRNREPKLRPQRKREAQENEDFSSTIC